MAAGKAPEAFRTIGEVTALLGLPAPMLRYWESQFPMLRPVQRAGGRRLYRPEDVELLGTIDRLVHREGYTLRGARAVLEGGGGESQDAASTFLLDLKMLRARLATALAG